MLQTLLCGILGKCETLQSSELGELKPSIMLVLELSSSVGGLCLLLYLAFKFWLS